MTFFATAADIAQFWRWLCDVPGMKVFEEYSIPGEANRWFDSWDQLSLHLEKGAGGLAAWPETVGGYPRAEAITFEPNTRRKLGAAGRTVLLSPALIRITRNNEQRGCLASASIGCWTEQGARQRSIFPEEFIDEVDWAALRSIVRKIQRQIERAAPAKLRAYPIMPDAFEKFEAGGLDLWNWGEACAHPSPLVIAT